MVKRGTVGLKMLFLGTTLCIPMKSHTAMKVKVRSAAKVSPNLHPAALLRNNSIIVASTCSGEQNAVILWEL